MKLNLGAGEDIRTGADKDGKRLWINHDIVTLPGIDIVWDLNIYPWPWADNAFDEVFCSHVLEHLDDLPRAMAEIRRICVPGASVLIRVPHFSCGVSYRDPTHKRLFSYFTWDYFSDKCFYNLCHFKVVKRKLNFTRETVTFLNCIINPIINISPALYERLWCWILPTAEVICELEVEK